MPKVDHVTHLEGIPPTNWQMRQYERLGKTAGTDHPDLACRGLTFVPPDCAAWLLEMEEDGPLNVLSASKGLFTHLNGQEPPFEEALDWLKFAYTAYRAGAYVVPASTVLN